MNGANVLDANDSKSLYDIFEKGSENRHVASTSELSWRNFEGVKFLYVMFLTIYLNLCIKAIRFSWASPVLSVAII